jgi:methyl-accepting chemotaxis protein
VALTEKIRVLFEVDDKGSFGKLKKDINDADGATGKLKAGAKGLGDSLKANAAAGAVAAGTALVAFGAKAASAFQDAAIGAGKFADATGLAVEDASRWIEVAGDIGIEAGTIQGAFQKLNKSIADGKPALSEYGVEIVKTKDGVVDANATFVNAATTIGAIEDPTKRAKAAQELFGKSYGEVAELLEMSAGDVQTALAGVSDAKVIDEEELAKARDMRARLDDLKDTFEDVTLGVGEFVVSMGPAITKIGDISKGIIGVTTAVADFLFAARGSSPAAERWWDAIGGDKAMSRAEAFSGFMEAVNDRYDNKSLMGNAAEGVELFFGGIATEARQAELRFEDFKSVFDDLAAKSPETAEQLLADMGKLRGGTDETSVKFQEWAAFMGLTDERILQLATSIPAVAEGIDEAGKAAYDASSDFADLDKQAYLAEDALDDVKDAAAELGTAYDKLKGKFDNKQAWQNAQDAVGDLMTTMADSESTWRDLETAADDAALAYADFIMQADHIPDETKSILITELDQGNLDMVRAFVDTMQKGFIVPLIPEIRDSKGTVNALGSYGRYVPGGTNVRGATGGIVTRPTMALIGEDGPEAVVPLNRTPGSSPLPSGLGGGNTYNFYGVDERFAEQLVGIIERHERGKR